MLGKSRKLGSLQRSPVNEFLAVPAFMVPVPSIFDLQLCKIETLGVPALLAFNPQLCRNDSYVSTLRSSPVDI